jgi:hypothetical protein
MKIAVVGWGSLIWNQGILNIKKVDDVSWFLDGPVLPIEFSRVSSDGRLTLVIDANASLITTAYAMSAETSLDRALENLANRETCNVSKIGYYDLASDTFHPKDFKFAINVRNWMSIHSNFEAIIWTNLEPNFIERTGKLLSKEDIIVYLSELASMEKSRAENYVRQAPAWLKTRYRSHIERVLGWYPVT